MNIKTIIYQRVKNLENYESERLEMTAELSDEDDPIEAAQLLKERVNEVLFPPKKEKEASLEDIPFESDF